MKNKRKLWIINIIVIFIVIVLAIPGKTQAANATTNNAPANNVATNTTATTTSNTSASTANKSKTATKSSNANLSNLGIKPHDFSGFKPNVTTYKASVPEAVEKVEVYAKAQDANATVSGIGEKPLVIGENKAEVVVTAANGTSKTYTITITRGGTAGATEDGAEEPSGDGLTELKIANASLTPEFRTDIYEYKAKYIGEETTLNVEANPTQQDYIVEVTGNNNLQEGEDNLITILVSKSDGENVATYQITLEKKLVDEEAIAREEAKKKEEQQKMIIGSVVAVILLIIIIAVIVNRKRSKKIARDFSMPYHSLDNDEDEKPKALRNKKHGKHTLDSEDELPKAFEPVEKKFKVPDMDDFPEPEREEKKNEEETSSTIEDAYNVLNTEKEKDESSDTLKNEDKKVTEETKEIDVVNEDVKKEETKEETKVEEDKNGEDDEKNKIREEFLNNYNSDFSEEDDEKKDKKHKGKRFK